MPYIHEQPDWPRFRWDIESLASDLARVRHKQGRLIGKMGSLGFDLRAEANLETLTSEIVTSSAIEGEILDAEEVRFSIGRRLGLDVGGLRQPGRAVDGVVEMMLDAAQNVKTPLTADRLFAWHAALFPTGRSSMDRIVVGAWRRAESGPMQVVSGPIGRETIHFEAPAAERLNAEMAAFLDWFKAPTGLDAVLVAGLAHLWFVTIHPFEDGNGRIGRAIADLALARSDGTPDRFYSMSSQIEAEGKVYYLELESTQRGGLDVTAWLAWFFACLERAIDRADDTVGAVLRKAALWERVNCRAVNERQRRVINRLLDGFVGFLTTSKYAKLAKCSPDTALRDVRQLLEWGILVQNSGGGRSTSYRLAEPDQIP